MNPSIDVTTLPLWKKIVFTLIPIGIFLGLVEITLRFTVPFQNVRALCFHPIMERDYCPNVTGVIKYDAVLTVNADGMIDKDYPVARPPGTLRVAVLGDSFTAGEEVGMGKRFHELWEERLSKKLGKPVEFLNFGVRGFGTWEQIQMFHLKAAKYQPDLTVVNLFWGNDIEDNINQFNAGAYNPLKEEYPVDSFWNTLLVARKNFNKWLWNHSAAYQWFRTTYNKFEFSVKMWLRPEYRAHQERLKEFQQKNPGATAEDMARAEGKPAGDAANRNPAAPPPGERELPKGGRLTKNMPSVYDDKFFFDSDAWKLTRDLFLKLKKDVEAAGSRLAVIHFVEEDQVHDYPDLPREEFNNFLMANGIPVLDTFPEYQKLTPKELVATTLVAEHDDHHFSAEGHKVYADFTEAFLQHLLNTPAKS